tara:strand:- start:594 stop:947 length:354 start_codon:yes stop_codon:yes gene_type:complete
MGCNSCKKNSASIAGLTITNNGGKKSIGVKILIFSVKIVLFIISSFLLGITVVPFSIYLLSKAMFFDGNIDIESLIVGVSNHFKDKKEDKIDKKDKIDLDDEEEYEYNHTDIDKINE